ncbi:hypothetical protein [Breoghania sp.]|uniref:hypothetical protein n=1 Tax=Breoghania sp. TaxID=2065378 RepID=UPI00263264E4|nr:hypothetical protein [Breoghania sp.]MDJ0932571.1 hypothetical protein [Breoghania sp.]
MRSISEPAERTFFQPEDGLHCGIRRLAQISLFGVVQALRGNRHVANPRGKLGIGGFIRTRPLDLRLPHQ